MKASDVLAPANEAEAEMAATAHECLMMALDHSRAEQINVILDVKVKGKAKHETPVLKLPPWISCVSVDHDAMSAGSVS